MVLKYIKWIFLGLLLVLLVIFGIRFVNYITNNADEYENNRLKVLQNTSWSMTQYQYYENGEIISNTEDDRSLYYMVFQDDYIKYCYEVLEECEDCESSLSECNEYKYIYKDEMITFEADETFEYNGTYDFKIIDSGEFQLSRVDGNKRMVYHFVAAKG